MPLAFSALDVAFVSAVAAVAAALAAPLSAYLVARENHKQEKWAKTYEDRRAAYQRALRALQTRRLQGAALAASLERHADSIDAEQMAADETLDQVLERVVAVGLFAPPSVRNAVQAWSETDAALGEAIRGTTWATDDEKDNSAAAIRAALKKMQLATRAVEDAIRIDLSKT